MTTTTFSPAELSSLLHNIELTLERDESLEPLHDVISEAAAIAAWKRDNHSVDLTDMQLSQLDSLGG